MKKLLLLFLWAWSCKKQKKKRKKEVFDAMRRFWVGKKRWKFVFFVLTTLFCFWLFLSGLSYNTSQPGTTKLKKKTNNKNKHFWREKKNVFFLLKKESAKPRNFLFHWFQDMFCSQKTKKKWKKHLNNIALALTKFLSVLIGFNFLF